MSLSEEDTMQLHITRYYKIMLYSTIRLIQLTCFGNVDDKEPDPTLPCIEVYETPGGHYGCLNSYVIRLGYWCI